MITKIYIHQHHLAEAILALNYGEKVPAAISILDQDRNLLAEKSNLNEAIAFAQGILENPDPPEDMQEITLELSQSLVGSYGPEEENLYTAYLEGKRYPKKT